MADVPKRAKLTASVKNGEVELTIEDDETLEKLDKRVYMWHPRHLSGPMGMDITDVEVER